MRIASRRTWLAGLAASALLAGVAPAARAQQYPYTKPLDSPVPMVTGVMGYQSIFTPGVQSVNPEFDPILLVPLGRKALIEGEYEVRLDLDREDGQWGPATVDHGIEYLQLDYFAHPNLTLTAGRFLTPFGLYRERIHPIWIRNLATEPIIFALNETSCNGGMLRGAARVGPAMNVTYATYYSAASQRKVIEAERQAGGRASLVFPAQRVELGFSFNRNLGDERHNMIGADLTWNVKQVPLDLRAEALRNPLDGKGYWLEGAYRLNRRLHLVVRGEQFWVPKPSEEALAASEEGMVEGSEGAPPPEMGGHEELPDRNTTRLTVGWNLYFLKGFRLAASYGRNFADGQNYNIWSAGVTYRFAIY